MVLLSQVTMFSDQPNNNGPYKLQYPQIKQVTIALIFPGDSFLRSSR